MMRIMVKVCGITNQEDALAACEAGVDAVGFNFWPGSPRYITPEDAARIAAVLPGTVIKVGLFVDSCAREIAEQVQLDVYQVHGDIAPPENVRYWIATTAQDPRLRGERKDPRLRGEGKDPRLQDESGELPEAFLVDAPSGAARGGTGQVFDWRQLEGVTRRIILAGGLSAENVAAAISTVRPWGVDACSRLESAPGRKDHNKLRSFVRAARSAQL